MLIKHGGRVFEVAEKLKINLNELYDYSSNINPFGLNNEIKELLKNSIDNIKYYPDADYKKAYKSISKYYKINQDNIIIGNGSIDLVYQLFNRIKINKIVLPVPNFGEYEKIGFINNIYTIKLYAKEVDNYKVCISNIEKYIHNNSIVIITNPNNPVGYSYSNEEIYNLIQLVEEKQSYLLIDEAFIDYSKYKSAIKYLSNSHRLIILKSLTKTMAIPGVRLGVLLSNHEIIKSLKETQSPWTVNYFAQSIAENINCFAKSIKTDIKSLISERKQFIKELKKNEKIKVSESDASYILFKIIDENNERLINEMLKKKILIRDCSNYSGLDNSYIRIAVKTKVENNYFLKCLDEVL